MSVREVEQLVQRWSRKEQEELRDWLENLLEDQLEMTDEFKRKIEVGFAEIADGKGRVKIVA
jgi:plasmid stabilization system protein ParE